MMLDIYGNMHPDYINYALIDSPLRKLIKDINKSSWARTIGSCAGRAHHKNKGGFYMIIEVKGMKGIRNLLRWLSLSHALGFKACREEHSLKDFAIPTAEIIALNLLHGVISASRPVMGNGWLKFQIRLHLGGKSLNKTQVRGGIKALELGWDSITNNYKKEGKN